MIFYGGEIYCTYLYIAGQRKIISKCLCCFPFRSTPNSRYCCSTASFITSCYANERFLQTEGGGQEGKMHFFCCFFKPAAGRRGRREEGRAERLVLLMFRCGSRTLWFLTSRTLCFPTLGWILSPWILSPRWACTARSWFVSYPA